jgi:hypothetical protein
VHNAALQVLHSEWIIHPTRLKYAKCALKRGLELPVRTKCRIDDLNNGTFNHRNEQQRLRYIKNQRYSVNLRVL